MEKKFCAYFRVSTARQGESHLGIEAQMKMCNDFAKQNSGAIIATFQDYESGKTEMYSLADFSPRKSENIEKAYLLGRFGAIPFIKGE